VGSTGAIEIGPVEPRALNAPDSHDGFAGKHFGGLREGFQPGIEIGVELARNASTVKKDLRRRRRLSGHWMALQSQLLHDLERGGQWIASALKQRNPDGFAITLERPCQNVCRR